MSDPHDPLLDEPAFVDLHDQLVRAAERRHAQRAAENRAVVEPAHVRRPRRAPLLVAAATVALVAVVSVVAWLAASSPPVAADVTVQRQGDRVRVLLEEEVSVESLGAAMRAEGLDVEVRGQTTGRSLQHRFLGSIVAPDVVLEGGAGGGASIASFPAGSRAVLMLGVPPKRGERYEVPTDATARGELLDGIDVVGRTVAEVEPILDALHAVDVEFRGPDGQPTSTPPAEATVVRVIGLADDQLGVFVG